MIQRGNRERLKFTEAEARNMNKSSHHLAVPRLREPRILQRTCMVWLLVRNLEVYVFNRVTGFDYFGGRTCVCCCCWRRHLVDCTVCPILLSHQWRIQSFLLLMTVLFGQRKKDDFYM